MAADTPAAIYRYGPWEIDLNRRELRADGVGVALGSRAFAIVEVLIEAPGALITKDEIARRVWPDSIVDDNTLQVHISALRKALGADRGLIKTTSGRGYRLLGNWTTERGAADATADSGHGSSPAPLGNLPIPATEMIGRTIPRQQIASLLTAHRVVSLVGPGGIGKTRLAVTIAAELAPDLADGPWFVDLAPLTDPALVPSVTAAALGLHLQGADITPLRVAEATADRQLLIVLDNCEHVIDAAAQLAEALVRTCARVSILTTSREPLRIEAECVYRVPPLDLPAEGEATPDDLPRYSAVRLFLVRIAALNPNLADTPAGLATIAEICRRLDGIPFAIELAAASAATLGLEETLRQLDHRFHLLRGGRRTAPPRQQTLRAMLDWSHDLLSEDERLVLRRISVFAGGFTLEAACAVAASPEAPSPEAPSPEVPSPGASPAAASPELDTWAITDTVAGLASKSLIAVDITGGLTRYSLLDTIRAYAIDRLGASGETQPVLRRHAAYCVQLMERAQAEWSDRSVEDWLAAYRPEIENIRAALDWAASEHGDPMIAVMLTTVSIPLMFDLSLIAECHRRVETALQWLRQGVQPDPRCEMHLLTALQATRIYTDGPSATNLAAWSAVLELANLHDDVEFQARALWGLWSNKLYSGAPAAALGLAERFKDIASARRDRAKAILGQRMIGTSLHYRGEQEQARRSLESFLARYDRTSHRWHIVGSRLDHATIARATLVRVLWLQGEVDAALRLSAAAFSAATADDHLLSRLYVLVEASIPLALAVGDFDSMERYVQILQAQAGRSGFRIWQIYAGCMPELLRVRRGDSSGLAELAAVIDDLRAAGFCQHLSMFLGGLARGQQNAGRMADALGTVDAAIDWVQRHDEGWNRAELLRIKAEIIRGEQSAEARAAATALFQQAMAVAHGQGSLSWELRAATGLARLLRRQDRPEAAFATLAPVYERFNEGFQTADLMTAKALLDQLR